MTNANWDLYPDNDLPHDDVEELLDGVDEHDERRRKERGKMPVARDARARAASKETWRSRRAAKRFGKAADGIHKRRIRRIP
jgi:hypothetical protein